MQKSKKYLFLAAFIAFGALSAGVQASDYAIIPNPPFSQAEMTAYFNNERRTLETNSAALVAGYFKTALADDFTFTLTLRGTRQPVPNPDKPGELMMPPGDPTPVVLDLKGTRAEWIAWHMQQMEKHTFKAYGVLGVQYDAVPNPISYNRVIDMTYKTDSGDFERDSFNRPLYESLTMQCEADFRRSPQLVMTKQACQGNLAAQVSKMADPMYPGQGIPTEPWHGQ